MVETVAKTKIQKEELMLVLSIFSLFLFLPALIRILT